MIQTGWCVLTGAPCSGKTTVLKALESMGYRCIPEAARVCIENELAQGHALSDIRRDEDSFQQKIVAMKMHIEAGLPVKDLIFLDRAMPDSITYYRTSGLDTTAVIKASQIFHYKWIFIFNPLPWQVDAVRNEDEKTIAFLDKELESDYRSLGYQPIRVPRMSVEERIDMILKTVNSKIINSKITHL